MKSIVLKGQKRDLAGKKDSKILRRQDQIPAILYGGESPISFQIDVKEISKIIYTPDVYLTTLDLDGDKQVAILKSAQFHPVKDSILHADFQLVVKGKHVIIELPVAFTGNSVGVRQGGKLRTVLRKIKVKGEAENLPESITVDVTNLNVGQTFKVKDLSLPGVEILNAPNSVIVGVKTSRAFIAAQAAQAAEDKKKK
jgi:large subunit ribosomal protein L25